MYLWQHDHAHNLSVLVILMHGIYYMWYVAEYWTTHGAFISMGWCKKNVPPLLTHGSYVCLALTHWYPHGFHGESCTNSGYTTKLIRIQGDRQWSIMHQEEGWCITLSILFSYHVNIYINRYRYINACNLRVTDRWFHFIVASISCYTTHYYTLPCQNAIFTGTLTHTCACAQRKACYHRAGPCITNVFATRRKNFSQWYRSFQRKLLSHWLKLLRHVAITLVIQGPGLFLGLRPASERRCYFATTYLIGWAQTSKQPW